MAPQSKAVKNSKKKTINSYKSQFPNTKKIPCIYVALLLLEFKHDL
jgi:hypothetical protein